MARLYINERWKEIDIAHPMKFRYAVSDFGRFMSFTDAFINGNILKCSNIDGYLYHGYSIRDGKKKINKRFYVHKLVAAHFLPKPNEDKIFVIHLDYNKSNNRSENLRWASKEEMVEHSKNSPHVLEATKMMKLRGIGHKLTSTKVKYLKKKIFDPERKTRLKMLAKQFNISEMQLYRIKRGENWGHITID